jgi:uncharacterized protein YjeT (DUF2065 family)
MTLALVAIDPASFFLGIAVAFAFVLGVGQFITWRAAERMAEHQAEITENEERLVAEERIRSLREPPPAWPARQRRAS